MQEDIQKNFILLSKVAKEKKYAQEYLGLLARRGDIGSIRIGKRWYTTWAWFEEFLENGLKKSSFAKATEDREEAASKVPFAVSAEVEEPAFAQASAGAVKINFSPAMPMKDEAAMSAIEKEPVFVKATVGEEVKINIPAEKRSTSISMPSSHPVKVQMEQVQMRGAAANPIRKARIRNFAPGRMARPPFQKGSGLRNIPVEERNRYAVSYAEIKLKKKEDVFSPNLMGGEKIAAPVFSRFALAMSFAMILLLVAASGYFVWSGNLLARGQVAGASDERNAGFSGITSGGAYVLTSAGDKMRESLSLSRVIIQAAKEKPVNEASAQPREDAKAVLINN